MPPSPPAYGGSPVYPASFEPDGPPTRSGKATAGFVLGLASIALFWTIVVPILAIIFGLLGAKEVKASGGRRKSMAFARIGWIFGAVALLGGAVLWGFAIKEVAGTTAVFDLEVGDCVELPDPDDEEVTRLETFDCTEAHGAEVFAIGDLGSGNEPYPGVTEVNDMISRECLPAFEAYVGVPYTDSEFDALPIYPSEENWEEEQGYVCLAYDKAGDLTESIKNSGR